MALGGREPKQSVWPGPNDDRRCATWVGTIGLMEPCNIRGHEARAADSTHSPDAANTPATRRLGHRGSGRPENVPRGRDRSRWPGDDAAQCVHGRGRRPCPARRGRRESQTSRARHDRRDDLGIGAGAGPGRGQVRAHVSWREGVDGRGVDHSLRSHRGCTGERRSRTR